MDATVKARKGRLVSVTMSATEWRVLLAYAMCDAQRSAVEETSPVLQEVYRQRQSEWNGLLQEINQEVTL